MPLPPNTKQDAENAIRLFRSGATRTMVIHQLQRNGVPQHAIPDVVAYATKSIRQRRRVAGAGITMLGLLTMAGGISLFAMRVNGVLVATIPVVIIVFGLVALIYGLYEVIQPRR